MITLLAVIVTIFLNGFFSGAETGCYTLSRLKLFYRRKQKDKKAIILQKLVKEPQKYVFMTLICQNIFVYITSILVTGYYIKTGVVGENVLFLYGFFPWSAEVAATLTLIFPLFIFAEVGPKNLFLGYSDSLMYKTVRFQQICFVICLPLVLVLKLLSDILPSSSETNYYNFDEMNIHKLKLFFAESHQDGVITTHQNSMINNLIKLQEVNVSSIMIPVNKLFALSVDDSPEIWFNDLKRKKNNYSDIPVYFKNKKRIIGTVEFFDVLNAVERNYSNLRKDMKKLMKLKNSHNIQQAFYHMQVNNENKALIIDKKRTIIGVLYLKDIITYISRR